MTASQVKQRVDALRIELARGKDCSLTPEEYVTLADYLRRHCDEITLDINDFGDLRPLLRLIQA